MTTSKDYKAIITEIYRRYNPDKIQEIPSLLEKYANQEDELVERIFAKYEFTDIEKQRLYQKVEDNKEVIPEPEKTSPSDSSSVSKTTVSIFVILAILVIAIYYIALNTSDNAEIRKLTTVFMGYAKTANDIEDYEIVKRYYSKVVDNAAEATITIRTIDVEVEKRQVGYVHLRFRKYDDGWGIVETAFTTSADHNREYYTFPAPLTLKTIKMITQNE